MSANKCHSDFCNNYKMFAYFPAFSFIFEKIIVFIRLV